MVSPSQTTPRLSHVHLGAACSPLPGRCACLTRCARCTLGHVGMAGRVKPGTGSSLSWGTPHAGAPSRCPNQEPIVSNALINTLPSVDAFVDRTHASFIDGQQHQGAQGTPREVHNPPPARCSRAPCRPTPAGGRRGRLGPSHLPLRRLEPTGPAERERVLLRFADLVEAHGESWRNWKPSTRASPSTSPAQWGRRLGQLHTLHGRLGRKIEGQTLDVSIPCRPRRASTPTPAASRPAWSPASCRGTSR